MCPSCALGSGPFGGGKRWCLPSEDLAGQALSAMPGSRWASLGRVVACLRVVRPGFAAGPLRQAPVVLSPAFQTWNSLGACCLAGVGWVGAASRQAVHPRAGCLYFKTCCPLRARQLWVCSMLLLTAAAVGATQPSAAKMRLDPPPPSVLFGLARPPVTSAEKRTVARLQFLPWCRQYGRLSLGAREGN